MGQQLGVFNLNMGFAEATAGANSFNSMLNNLNGGNAIGANFDGAATAINAAKFGLALVETFGKEIPGFGNLLSLGSLNINLEKANLELEGGQPISTSTSFAIASDISSLIASGAFAAAVAAGVAAGASLAVPVAAIGVGLTFLGAGLTLASVATEGQGAVDFGSLDWVQNSVRDIHSSLGNALQSLFEAVDSIATSIGETTSSLVQNIGSIFDSISLSLSFGDVFPGPTPRGLIDPRCNIQFQSATTFVQRSDPLTLDLDADGLETTGINPSNPILFDHNGDGIKTATGWVKPDDAFLVFDRNNNGTIDSGKELFGDATALYTGGTAADGFAALAQEDTNADGLVNASDANWNSLKLWRDLNQDGISQSNELFTLGSQNIAALKVASTDHSQTLANGNQIADLGGYIKTDGSNGTLGAVSGMADINLANNPFYSQFTDTIPLTEAAQGIADMQGAGMVRRLREAASLNAGLVTQVNALAGQTRSQMLQSLDTLLKDWSATSDFISSGQAAQGYGYALKYLPAGTNTADVLAAYGLNGTNPASLPEAERNRLAGLRQQIDTLNQRMTVLERFNGSRFVTVSETGIVSGTGQSLTRQTAAGGAYVFMALNGGNQGLLEQSYAQLKDSVYGGVVLQTRLNMKLFESMNDREWRMAA
jgi:hypothetical protein